MTTGSGKLIAFRSDRLGGRLIALLNTLRIARSHGMDFVVYWRDSDGMGDGSDLFRADFIRDHFISKDQFQAMRAQAVALNAVTNDTADALRAHLNSGHHLLIDHPFGAINLPFENPEECRALLGQEAARLPLNDRLAACLDDLRGQLRDGRRLVAYHIRRGDLTADMRATNRAWPNKFTPDEFFETDIRRNVDNAARTILFSDNRAVLDRYTKMFPTLMTLDALRVDPGLTPLQRDATELFAMAQADEIVAPPSSAFSSTAATLGGGVFFDIEKRLPPQDRHAALDLLSDRLRHQPEIFANSGEIGQYLAHAHQHLTTTGRTDQFIDTARFHIDNGLNISFVYARTARELYHQGRWQEVCDLFAQIQRGYVYYQRSYAQIQFFHGLSLLMLGRRAEGLDQIASAFWHEPVEGEINVLAGLLRASRDFHDGNFMTTDPVIEVFFGNQHTIDHVRSHLRAPVAAGVIAMPGIVPNCRLLTWEWPWFTRSDNAGHDRLQGLIKATLDALARHSFGPERQPHFGSLTGMLHLRMNQPDDAERAIDAALTERPDNAIFWKRRADMRIAQGRWDDALRDVDHAIGLRPDMVMLAALRGFILHRAGDAQGATDALQPLYGRGLRVPSVSFLGAEAAQAVGRIHDAAQMLTDGLALAPINWRRQVALARLQLDMDQTDAAHDRLAWTLQWAGEHPPVARAMLDVLDHQGRPDDARDLLTRLADQHPDKTQFSQWLNRRT
ncbi:tetratricopeptide repeat protein [Paracoccus sp. (in: a-proteobacteria)]|uniref:tetratricopeptide repeat protein n=1 Tax=Paracoccus sp. TaxID=267 RepID=UPI0026DFECDE|nr:tetratricopeptide repeat protein [Paracoccus sp. (in: a-proteobacteria)]MDO5647766.1 tetratricopeptide repeat protein [Paracoccus sp. (in: a-proteobacteria)]